jgi:hypothetical protein
MLTCFSRWKEHFVQQVLNFFRGECMSLSMQIVEQIIEDFPIAHKLNPHNTYTTKYYDFVEVLFHSLAYSFPELTVPLYYSLLNYYLFLKQLL